MSKKNEIQLYQPQNNAPKLSPESLVAELEQKNGNLSKFLEHFASILPEDKEIAVGSIELWLSKLDDKAFLHRWHEAIRRGMALRLRLLQNRAMERIESLALEEKGAGWAQLAKEQLGHKLVLAPLLTGENHQAKQARVAPEVTDDQDDEDADAAMNY